jgi:hypothetical protein
MVIRLDLKHGQTPRPLNSGTNGTLRLASPRNFDLPPSQASNYMPLRLPATCHLVWNSLLIVQPACRVEPLAKLKITFGLDTNYQALPQIYFRIGHSQAGQDRWQLDNEHVPIGDGKEYTGNSLRSDGPCSAFHDVIEIRGPDGNYGVSISFKYQIAIQTLPLLLPFV